MSKDIFESEKLLVTAFIGAGGEPCVQIGIKTECGYEQLGEEQIRDLALALLARVHRVEGFRATDP